MAVWGVERLGSCLHLKSISMSANDRQCQDKSLFQSTHSESSLDVEDRDNECINRTAQCHDATKGMNHTTDQIGRLLEATGIVPWEANAETWQFAYVGDHARSLLGYPVDQWYEKDFWVQHLFAEDRARAIEFCIEHSQTDDQYQFEYRMQRADDRIVWVQDIVNVVREDGRPVLLRGFLVDVTSRKQAEEALRESQERFLLAVHGSNTGLWIRDLTTNEIYLSPRWKSMLGYEASEITDGFEEWERRIHPEDRERVLATLKEYLSGCLPEYENEYRLRHKDGSYRWILSRGVSVRDAMGKPTMIAGSHVDITKLKEAQEALKVSVQSLSEREMLFGKLAEAIDQVFWLTELNPERVIYVSPAFEQIWAVPVEILYRDPRSWLSMVHAGDQERVAAAFEAYVRGQAPAYNIEYRIQRPDGAIRWICDEGARIVDTFGEVRWISGIAKDITEQKGANDALRESEERFRLMADSAPVMIWMSDLDKHCIYFNKRWLDFTGRTIEKELGEGWAENVHPEDLRRCIKKYSNAFDDRRPFVMEYRLRRFDGEYRWIADFGTPRYEPSGAFCGYIGSCIDITDRKLAQDAMRESEAKFRALFESNVLPIVYWHESDAVVDANDAYLRLIGFTQEELKTGKVRWDPTVPDTEIGIEREAREVLASRRQPFIQFEKEYRLRDGRHIHVLVGASLLPGKSDSGMAFVVDLTERKLTEQKLRDLTARLFHGHEEERTKIARELHDDIGQRLALIEIELEQLSQMTSEPSDEVPRLIQELGKQTREIATDVQHISHELHPPKLEYLGLVSAVKALCRELSVHKKIRIDVEAHDMSTSIPRNVALCVYRVVQEALQNVVKHSRSAEARVVLEERADHMEVCICDSGIGFDPKSTAAKTGIGLVSMHERLRLVRGTLAIESHPRQGTSIKIYVPLTAAEDEEGKGGLS